MTIRIEVRGEFIKLDQVLKASGLCDSGGRAHTEIDAGKVQVDGQIEMRRRAKLSPGQKVSYVGQTVLLVRCGVSCKNDKTS